MLTHACLLIFLRRHEPFVHTFMNRFSTYGSLHTIICYASAINAVNIDDPDSPESMQTFAIAALGTLGLFVVYELVRSSNSQGRSGLEHGRWHKAENFGEVYSLASEDTVQITSDGDSYAGVHLSKEQSRVGYPLDEVGQLCCDSGLPAAFTEGHRGNSSNAAKVTFERSKRRIARDLSSGRGGTGTPERLTSMSFTPTSSNEGAVVDRAGVRSAPSFETEVSDRKSAGLISVTPRSSSSEPGEV